MMSPPLVASKHTCYKLITSLSTRARNVNALDKCRYVPHAQSTGACIPSVRCVFTLITHWECCPHSQNKNNTCSGALSLFSGKEQNPGSYAYTILIV